MSFALPSVKPKPELSHAVLPAGDPNFEVPNMMMNGFSAVAQRSIEHPLIQSERNYHNHHQNMNNVILRNTQGLHAPLRLNMELKSVQKVGHLPFLQRHNVLLDSLTGRDIEIGPEDIFNTAEFGEKMGQPHAIVEKQLGLL